MLSREHGEEGARIHHGDVAVLSDSQQIVVAGHEVVGAARCRATEKVVVVGVTADAGSRFVRKQGRFGPQKLEERVSIARRDAVLTSWFVSGSALSTPAAASPVQGLPYVATHLAVRDGRESTANPVDDLEPGLAFGDQPLELLRADDPDHRDPGLFDQDTDLAALDLLHDLAELRPSFQGWNRLELHLAGLR